MVNADGLTVVSEEAAGGIQRALILPHSVLMIRQMREVHASITEFMGKIQHGDAEQQAMEGMGCGMGGGGFGGGFFSVPEAKVRK